jgi:ERCC4-related helicase
MNNFQIINKFEIWTNFKIQNVNNFQVWTKFEIWTIFKFEQNSKNEQSSNFEQNWKYEQYSSLNKIRNMNIFQIWTKFKIWTFFKFEQNLKNLDNFQIWTKIQKRTKKKKWKKNYKKTSHNGLNVQAYKLPQKKKPKINQTVKLVNDNWAGPWNLQRWRTGLTRANARWLGAPAIRQTPK